MSNIDECKRTSAWGANSYKLSLKYEINNENEDQRENVQNVTTAQKYENKNLLKYCKPKKHKESEKYQIHEKIRNIKISRIIKN